MTILTPLERKVEAAEKLLTQGYLRRTVDGGVTLTRRGKRALEQFTGGMLAEDSFDLDSTYYGAEHANRRRDVTWAQKFLNAWAQVPAVAHEQTAGDDNLLIHVDEEAQAALSAPRPKPEPLYEWMEYFHEIDEPSLARLTFGGWEGVTCWRLDVHRAIAEEAKKRSRNRLYVFALYCEGWTSDEIGQLLHSVSPNEAWSSYTVNDIIGQISRSIRWRTNVRLPRSGARDPNLAPMSLTHRAEEAIAWARSRRKPTKRKLKQAA